MSEWVLVTIILVLSLVFLAAFIVAIGIFGKRTQYWQRQFGEERHWDLDQLGSAVTTYRVDPDNSENIELELVFRRPNGEVLRSSLCFDRRDDVEREVYGLFVEMPVSWVQKEVGKLLGYSDETMRKFGLRRKPKLVEA